MNRLLFWMKGYVQASIPTENAERFVNILRAQDIRANCFQIYENRCRFRIARSDYRLLLPLARKTSLYPRIHKKCGGYYIYKRLLQQSGLYLGMLCFVIFIYIMSQFLWNIEFVGNSMHTEEQLLQFLEKEGVGFGSRTTTIMCSRLEEGLRKEFQDISWASVELHGSRLMIRMKENVMLQKKDKIQGCSHIVATQNGIVTEIITRTGTPKVKTGDSVKQGDILIEGFVNTVNEYEELIRQEGVLADGDVNIKADIIYDDSFPINYKRKTMTGKIKKGYCLTINKKKIFSYIPSIPYKSYDIITTSVTWKISDNLYLPISQDTISCVEYKEEDARHSNAELAQTAYRRYLNSMEQYLSSGYRIFEEQVELEILDDVCQLQGTVTLEGPFWHREEVSYDEPEGIIVE